MTIRRAAIAVSLASAAMVAGPLTPASADVSSVKGSAFGYSLQVSLFAGPVNTRGAGQVACSGSNNPPGCADNPTASESPSVSLPTGGGNLSSTKSTPTTASVGPATFFSATQLSASSSGTTGAGGTVTSSASANGVNSSGLEAFTASSVSSTCTATETGKSGSATISGGVVETDNGDATHAPVTVTVPTNPAPNTVIAGHLHPDGGGQENFEYIFNEQIINPDGSITVNAVHQRLLGPTAVGDLYIGQSVCGVVATGTPANVNVGIGDSPDPVNGGGTVTYTVQVGNSGASAATGVTLSGTLDNARLLDVTASDGTCAVLKGKSKGIECSLGTIAGGSSETVTIVAKAPRKAGTMSLTATATATNDVTGDTDTETTTIT